MLISPDGLVFCLPKMYASSSLVVGGKLSGSLLSCLKYQRWQVNVTPQLNLDFPKSRNYVILCLPIGMQTDFDENLTPRCYYIHYLLFWLAQQGWKFWDESRKPLTTTSLGWIRYCSPWSLPKPPQMGFGNIKNSFLVLFLNICEYLKTDLVMIWVGVWKSLTPESPFEFKIHHIMWKYWFCQLIFRKYEDSSNG